FDALLEEIGFNPERDRLWLVGDLVNRGPDSLATLRRVIELGDAVTTVLGNHDLHLLAAVAGVRKPRPGDPLGDVLAAPDARRRGASSCTPASRPRGASRMRNARRASSRPRCEGESGATRSPRCTATSRARGLRISKAPLGFATRSTRSRACGSARPTARSI